MNNKNYAGSYANLINAAATANISKVPVVVLGVFTSTNGGGGTFQLYDSATTTTTDPMTGAVVGVAGTFLPLNMSNEAGLYAVLVGTLNITVVYAPC